MSKPVIFGPAQSSYVYSARMALARKGVDHDLEAVEFGSPQHLALHPFGKVPAMRHDGRTIYETIAICRYVDSVFDGPPLQPADPFDRAKQDAWMSATVDYLYPSIIKNWVLQYIFPSGPDGQPDMETIVAWQPKIRQHLSVLDAAYDGQPYLAGGQFSLADMIVGPVIFYASTMPEWSAASAGLKSIPAALDALRGQPSFQSTMPPEAQEAA